MIFIHSILVIYLLLFFFILLPIQVDRTHVKRAYGTYFLLLLQMISFLACLIIIFMSSNFSAFDTMRELKQQFGFHGQTSGPWRAVTCLFIHSNILAFLNNFWALFIFGKAFENHAGAKRLFVMFFIGGVFSIFSQAYISNRFGSGISDPLIGSSGAVAALIGACIVLMPWSDVKIMYFYWVLFFFTGSGTLRLATILWVVCYFGLGAWFVPGLLWVHVGGFCFGFLVAGYMYGFRAVTQTEGESMKAEIALERSLRRSFRDDKREMEKERKNRGAFTPSGAPSPAVLARLVGEENAHGARIEFNRLLERNPQTSLDPLTQLELADLLASDEEFNLALVAFDNLAAAHPGASECRQGLLRAAVLAAQNAENHDRARHYLECALEGMPTGPERQWAEQFLANLPAPSPTPIASDPVSRPATFAGGIPETAPAYSFDFGPDHRPKRRGMKREHSFELLPPGANYNASGGTPGGRPVIFTSSASVPLAVPEAVMELARELIKNNLRHILAQDSRPPASTASRLSRDESNGSYSLIFAPAPRLSPAELARLLLALSKRFSREPDSIASRLRSQPGFLLTDASADKAIDLREELRDTGVQTRLAPNSPAWRLPESVEAVALRVAARKWRWYTFQGDEIEMAPGDVTLMAAGQVRVIPGSDRAPCSIDFIEREKGLRVRVWEHNFDLGRVLGLEPHPANLHELARHLADRAPRAFRTASLNEWIEGDGQRPVQLFNNPTVYDYYNRWRLLSALAPEPR